MQVKKGKRHLTELHKKARLGFKRKNMSLTKNWKKVIFSDEKKNT